MAESNALKTFVAKTSAGSVTEAVLTMVIGACAMVLCLCFIWVSDIRGLQWLLVMVVLFVVLRYYIRLLLSGPVLVSHVAPSGLVSAYLMPPRDSDAKSRTFEFCTRSGRRIDVVMAWDGAAYLHDYECAKRFPMVIETRLRDRVEMCAGSDDVKYQWRVKRYYDEHGKLSKYGWTLSVVIKANGAMIDSLSVDACPYTDDAPDTDPRRCSSCQVTVYSDPHQCSAN